MKSLNSAISWLDTQKLIFIIFFVVSIIINPLADPDYFWHLETGEYIASQMQLPVGDIFSFSKEGAPWVLHEWLFELFIFYVHAFFGDWGVSIFTSLILTATIIISFGLISKKLGNTFLGIILTVLVSIMVSSHISPRPHLVGFLFFAIYMRILFAYKYKQNSQHFLWMPLLMIAWVNIHGGYIVALALLIAFGITESISAKSIKKHLPLWKVTGWVLLASLVNPDFIDRLIYPFEVFNLKAAIAAISEWQSPNFHDMFYKGFLVLFGIFVMVNVYSEEQPDLTEFIIPACFIFMTFVSQRYTPFAAMVMLFFMSNKMTKVPLFKQLGWVDEGAFTIRKQDLGNREYIINWVILLFGSVAITFSVPIMKEKHRVSFEEIYPVHAAQYVLDNQIQGRMFNGYNYGGYLIHRLYPQQKVFIDGRADMYGDDFIANYLSFAELPADWADYIEQHAFDFLILEKNNALRHLLLLRGDFKTAYEDDHFTVLLKDAPTYSHLLRDNSELNIGES